MNVNINYHPYSWLRDVHNSIDEKGKGYFHVIKSKRQCGKSIMLEIILLKVALERNRSESYSVSPTIAQCQKMYKELKDIVVDTKTYKKHNDVQLCIEFINGSSINFKSAQLKEALRGYTCSGILVVDESAYIDDETFASILAWTNVHQPPVVLCSTPNFQQGFFYEYYMQGLNGASNIISYDWNNYDTSSLLTEDRLQQYKKTLSKTVFKTDYLGEFLALEGSVFGEFLHCINNNVSTSSIFYMGIDWGSGQGKDYTAITILNDDNLMVNVVYFNDKDVNDTISCILELIKQYLPLKVNVEANSIGTIFFDILNKKIKETGINTLLNKLTTTNESKLKMVNNLQVHIQNSTILLLNDTELFTELSMYEMKPSATGKPTYNASNGYHDDILISLMLALEAKQINYKPSIFFI